MNLRRKLLLQFFGLAVLPMALVAAVVAVGAYRHTEGLTKSDVSVQLDAMSQRITRTFRSEMFFVNNFLEEYFGPFDYQADSLRARPRRLEMPDLLSFGGFTRVLESPPFIDRRILILVPGSAHAFTLRRRQTREGLQFVPDSLTAAEVSEVYSRIMATPSFSDEDFRPVTSIDPTGPIVVLARTLPPTVSPQRSILALEYPLLGFFGRLELNARPAGLHAVFAAAKPEGSDTWITLHDSDPTRIGLPFDLDAFDPGGAAASTEHGSSAWQFRRQGDLVVATGMQPTTGWILGASVSFSERFVPMRRSILLFLILFGLMAAVVAAGILFATRGISVAVESIAEGTDAIARGELGQSIRLARSDEFGVIAQRINAMGHELLLSAESRAIARISARLVHDLKGVVSQMNLLLYNLKENYADPEFRSEFFTLMEGLVSQVESIVLKLRHGEETDACVMTPVNVSDVLSRIVTSPLLKSRPDVQVDVQAEAKNPAITDLNLLVEALENVVANAVEAMQDRGSLRIRSGETAARRVQGSQPDALPRSSNASHATHFIEIEDTGPGMSEDFVATELFRPFSTTKSGGIGLGMYTVRTTMQRLGGRVSVRSREGRGTTIRLEFGNARVDP